MYLKAEITNRNVLCKTKQLFGIHIEKTLLHWLQTSRTTPPIWFTYPISHMPKIIKHGAEIFQTFSISKNEIWPKKEKPTSLPQPFYLSASAKKCKHFPTERYHCLKIGSSVPTSSSLAGTYVRFGLQKK